MAATPYLLPRETRESVVGAGNGTAGPYGPSDYKVFDTVDVKVFAKALGETVFSDVTAGCTIAKVNPANAYDYFTVTFGAAVPATTAWFHQARRVAERSVAVTRGGSIDSNQLEKELSKQATVESEVRRDLDRAYAAQPGSGPGFVIPGAAGELMMSDAAGNLVSSGENVTTIEGATDTAVAAAVAASGSAAASAASAAAAAAAASAINLPTPEANTFLQRNAGNTAYDPKTADQVRTAIDPQGGAFSAPIASPAIRTINSAIWDRMDLRDWDGLDLTDTNDNASLLAAALVASGASGQTLHIPAGKFALGSEVVMPAFAKIQGEGRMSSIYGGIAYVDQKATILHIGHTGKGLTLTGPGARSIKGITTYRTQPTPSATIPTAYTPTAHDFDIYMTAVQDVILDEIMLLNPTKGVCAIGDATLGGNNRIDFGRIKGQPLSVGIELHHCYDVVFGENIQFWPYWTNNMNVRQHMRTNAKALSWSRVDGPAFGRVFSIGYRHGLFVDNDATLGGSTPGGTVSKGRVEMLFADSAASALWIENTATGANLSFGAFYGQSGTEGAWTTDSYLVRDRGTNSRVDFGHLELVLAHNQMVNMDGTGGTMQADKVLIDRWDTGTLGAGAFVVQGTNNRLSVGQVTRISPPAADPYQTAGTNPILETPDWRTYAATVTAISGTLTTVGTVATRYQRRGKVMKVSIDVTITDIGTGTAGINVTMPAASVSPATGIWKNTATNASGVIALLGASSTAALTAFPVANGQRFLGSIEYEVG